jgi:hypothetical protein
MPLLVPVYLNDHRDQRMSDANGEEFIHQQNLQRYRKMLSEKTHEPQRLTILRLLADEEARDDAVSNLDL